MMRKMDLYIFALWAINGRWLEIEPIITRPYLKYLYVRNIIQGPWPEAELISESSEAELNNESPRIESPWKRRFLVESIGLHTGDDTIKNSSGILKNQYS